MKTYLLLFALAAVVFHLLRYAFHSLIICSTNIGVFFETSSIDPASFFPRFVAPFVLSDHLSSMPFRSRTLSVFHPFVSFEWYTNRERK